MEQSLALRYNDLTPKCTHPSAVKKGFFKRKCDSKRVQKFLCKECGLHFSAQTEHDTYRRKRVREIPNLLKALTSGSSQRRAARNLNINRKTVARMVNLLARRAAASQEEFVRSYEPLDALQFDEMETFEHTKCKPLSMPLVVTSTRHILAIGVACMPAKGPLAPISVQKYGPRRDDRSLVIRALLAAVGPLTSTNCEVFTDLNPHYPGYLKAHLPHATHKTTLGGRGCSVGYGELKRKGFDPMFALNHTAAMLRDGLATLKRKTWTTVKKPENLLKLLMIYTWYHNSVLVGI